jgi:hypothetical protein
MLLPAQVEHQIVEAALLAASSIYDRFRADRRFPLRLQWQIGQ